MLCPMHSRKHFGYESFLDLFNSLFLALSLFYPIIKQLALFPFLLLFLLILNTQTFVITSFVLMSRKALSKLFGYQLRTCQLIFLQNHLILHYFLVIEKSLAFQYLYLNSFYLLFSSFRSDGGVLTDYIYSQNVSHHVTISRSLYTCTSFLFLSCLSYFPTLRCTLFPFLIVSM